MKENAKRLRRAQALAIAATWLALSATMAACGPSEETSMPPATTMPKSTIPALDAATPAHIETATLALG